MQQYSRVYKYIVDNLVDENEDYQIHNIKKIEPSNFYKDAYFLVSGAITHEDGTTTNMQLKIYWGDVYGN